MLEAITELKQKLILKLNKIIWGDNFKVTVRITPNKIIFTTFNNKSNKIYSLESSIAETLEDNLFVNFNCKFLDEEILQEKIGTIKQSLKEIIKYWIQSCEVKDFSLFIDCYQHNKNSIKILSGILFELGFKDYTKQGEMFDCENVTLEKLLGFLTPKKEKVIMEAYELYRELTNIKRKEPTFTFDSYDYSKVKGLFKLNRENYYFQNTILNISVLNGEILLSGQHIHEKRFLLETALHNIITYIKEHQKLPNLINPPRRHFSYLLNENLKILLSKRDIDRKINEIEEKIIGSTLEDESAYLNVCFNQEINAKRKNNKLKEIQINLSCKLYKLMTPNYIWFILVNMKENELLMVPSKNNATPGEIIKSLLNYLEKE